MSAVVGIVLVVVVSFFLFIFFYFTFRIFHDECLLKK